MNKAQKERETLAQDFFPDEVFKETAQLAVSELLITAGEKGQEPQLIILTLTQQQGAFGAEYLALQDPSFNDYEARAATLYALGKTQATKRRKVVVVFMATEAWVSDKIKDGKPAYQQAGDDPDRREAVVIFGKTLDERSMVSAAFLQRGPDKKITAVDQQPTNYDLKRSGTIECRLLDNFWDGYKKTLIDRVSRRPGWGSKIVH